MKVSVVVPVRNEAADLPRLLASLKFADEVIIIDTGSTDNSIDVAQELGAKVVREKLINFAQIRNFGAQLARNEFILSIDADNEVTPELSAEISKLPETKAAYKIGRINIIWGKQILHADWGPEDDCHIRLYHRGIGEFRGDVHEQFTTSIPAKKLKGRLMHHNYSSISEFIDKLNRYSDLAIRVPWWYPFYDFLKRYLYKLGFLEGFHGFFLCLLQSVYYLSVNIKLYQLNR